MRRSQAGNSSHVEIQNIIWPRVCWPLFFGFASSDKTNRLGIFDCSTIVTTSLSYVSIVLDAIRIIVEAGELPAMVAVFDQQGRVEDVGTFGLVHGYTWPCGGESGCIF